MDAVNDQNSASAGQTGERHQQQPAKPEGSLNNTAGGAAAEAKRMTQREVYERLWKQQKALQVLQAARELLQQFPNSAYLVELVQRLQHELNAWGHIVDTRELGVGAMEREPQHFHMQQQVQQQAGVWGLGPVAPQPPQVQQQAVMDASYLQGLYEHAWDEQQTVQTLRVALQGLQLFPKDTSLLRLVWRLRKELKAWGNSVPMDLLTDH